LTESSKPHMISTAGRLLLAAARVKIG
jgi:hypothetical protein